MVLLPDDQTFLFKTLQCFWPKDGSGALNVSVILVDMLCGVWQRIARSASLVSVKIYGASAFSMIPGLKDQHHTETY